MGEEGRCEGQSHPRREAENKGLDDTVKSWHKLTYLSIPSTQKGIVEWMEGPRNGWSWTELPVGEENHVGGL